MQIRLDQYLLDNNLVENRSKARGLIVGGKVIVNNEKVTKPGTQVNPEKINVTIVNNEREFVSRAGKKLFKALTNWQINLKNLVCLDIGSSTGGFTQCCLEFGARKVYALDVGTNQLDWKLRSDSRVVSMEKTNFRTATKSMFDDDIDFYCCDVSFISITKILQPLATIARENSIGVFLIKPQFESEREDIKKGKAGDMSKHPEVIANALESTVKNGFSVIDLDFSPILGNKKKNIEYLMYIKKSNNATIKFKYDKIEKTVKAANTYFTGDFHG